MFFRLKIRAFIIASIFVLATFTLMQGAASIWTIKQVGGELNTNTDNLVPSILALGGLRSDVGNMQAILGQHILAATPAATAERDRELAGRIADFDRNLTGYEKLVSDAKEAGLFEGVKRGWAAWKETIGPIREASLKIQTAEATQLFNGEQLRTAHQLDAALTAEMLYNQQLATGSGIRGDNLTTDSLIMAIVLTTVAMVVAGGVFLLVGRRLTGPLGALTSAMNRMADGELDLAVPGAKLTDELGDIARALDAIKASIEARTRADGERDLAIQQKIVSELGTALDRLKTGKLHYRIMDPFPGEYEALRSDFNAAIAGLAASITGVVSSAVNVRTGAAEVATASGDMARRTEQQAASLEETAAAIDEVTSSVQNAAKGAADVSRTVSTAHDDAIDGGRVVSEAVAAMGGIEKSAQQISQIVTMIDGIAFQTNLLALNAGVEAARAGDAGRGFAVVASEVRALAQRSADAAKEINLLIGESTRQVDAGVKLVGQTGDVLERIVGRIGEVSSMIQNMAVASQEQASAVQQVNSVIGGMDQMTQQNAAMVEETAAAASSLADQADVLGKLVENFELEPLRPARSARGVVVTASPRSHPVRSGGGLRQNRGNLALAVESEDDWTEF
jgi:methyl-accepting chemotaxis protein